MTGEQRVQQAETRVKAAMIAIGTFAFASVAIAVLLLLPYNPMTVVSYAPLEDEVCVRQPMEVTIEYELSKSLNVSSIETESSWTAVNVPDITDGQIVSGLNGVLAPKYSDEATTDILPRIAPPEAGEWQMSTEIDVHGTRYGLPYVQRVTAQAPETTTVIARDDPRCEEGVTN